MYIRDTIAAIATPFGSGGIGIVRVSGPESSAIASIVFRSLGNQAGGGLESHRLFYGSFVDPVTGAILDEGMCVLMKAPRSYTREDVVEFHCHGSMLVVRRLLELILRAGARLATPGEFTKRAFLNGRIDLSQAEAVADIITSKTDRGLALAQSQRSGALARIMAEIQSDMRTALALIEAYVDFPEDEVSPEVLSAVDGAIARAEQRVADLITSYGVGSVLREGGAVLLLGRPNAGKSSLLNALLGEESAIVSDIPGTTRDLKTEQVSICGVPVTIIDAAGIRSHLDDAIEQEGVKRALERIGLADLVLHLVDGTAGVTHEDLHIIDQISAVPRMTVITKCDLPPSGQSPHELGGVAVCHLSTKTGHGISALQDAIFRFFLRSDEDAASDRAVISNVRHRDVLLRASASILSFKEGLSGGMPPEIVALDLRSALASLGEICGETSNDDLLDIIFSSFCIGK